MENILNVVIAVVCGLLVLTVLVVAHEWGHFIVGRKCKITILEFGVGFGPKIWHKFKNGIQYSVRALPLGGFVQFEGEDQDSADKNAFNNAAIWKRALTVAAGPIMNLIVAFLITVIVLTAFGDYLPAVYAVEDGSPAQEAGLMPEDVIICVDDKKIDFYSEYRIYMDTEPWRTNDSLKLTVERSGEVIDLDIPYFYDSEFGRNRIGMSYGQVRAHYGFFEAIALAFKWMYLLIAEMLSALGGLIFAGKGAADLAGPVGTIMIVGDAVKSGFETLLRIAAILSINLGIVNLLPFPALDGGRLVLIGIEKLRGKPFPREKEGYFHFAGLVVLFGLMILLTYQDIARWAGGG